VAPFSVVVGRSSEAVSSNEEAAVPAACPIGLDVTEPPGH